ncbi:hypothetical protein V9T40_014467 [Parthenolecanium corni]|uniref:Uncharacterized protein n=1 Tax=Parthenolecanium corni TaxID=536013 RepID=A0AAN9XXI8_9HEMI
MAPHTLIFTPPWRTQTSPSPNFDTDPTLVRFCVLHTSTTKKPSPFQSNELKIQFVSYRHFSKLRAVRTFDFALRRKRGDARSKFGRVNTKTALPSTLGVLTEVHFADLRHTSTSPALAEKKKGGNDADEPPLLHTLSRAMPPKTAHHFLLPSSLSPPPRRYTATRVFPQYTRPADVRRRILEIGKFVDIFLMSFFYEDVLKIPFHTFEMAETTKRFCD